MNRSTLVLFIRHRRGFLQVVDDDRSILLLINNKQGKLLLRLFCLSSKY
jgi:hypothetical protein